jgi:Lrp/AsnC family transcriptional regulator, leucine-responsive regulatory protein
MICAIPLPLLIPLLLARCGRRSPRLPEAIPAVTRMLRERALMLRERKGRYQTVINRFFPPRVLMPRPPPGYRSRVEEINRTIVSLLARDGRMSFTELAKRTGLSVSAAQQRVRRLERRGVIKGYAAIINPDDAGLPLTAFISIKPFDPAAADDAPERLAHLRAIEACHSVAGDENYILKVRVGTPAELENLLQEIRSAASVSTRTTIVLSTPYENRAPNV